MRQSGLLLAFVIVLSVMGLGPTVGVSEVSAQTPRPRASSVPTARPQRASVRRLSVTRVPTRTAAPSGMVSVHVAQRVRAVSTPPRVAAPRPGSQSLSGSSAVRRMSQRVDRGLDTARQRDVVRRLSTSASTTRTAMRPSMAVRLKSVLRRMIPGRRAAETQTLETAEARHPPSERPRRASQPRTTNGGVQRGGVAWPPNRGFTGTPQSITLPAGTRIDRYGHEGGRFVSPEGTPYEQRALPYAQGEQAYASYQTTRPLTVSSGRIAPWFNQPGGGTQHLLPQSVRNLTRDGALVRMTYQPAGNPRSSGRVTPPNSVEPREPAAQD